VFGGREGDGKKRIVNDLFIFDTGKFKYRLISLMVRETILATTQSRKAKTTLTQDGTLQPAMERFTDNHIRRMEWISGVVRCHIY
jgi:hypothetical protein